MENKTKVLNGESDFGKGLVYSLFLFAKHWDYMSDSLESYQRMYPDDEKSAYSHWLTTWANGSSDHFYELTTRGSGLPKELKLRVKALQDKGLEIGHGFRNVLYTPEDFAWLFSEAEDICIEIDKLLGIKVVKARWN